MKFIVQVQVVGDPSTRRRATWQPKPNGPWSKELQNLVAAYEVGEIANGMVADIVGGIALTAFGNAQTRARHAEPSDRGRTP